MSGVGDNDTVEHVEDDHDKDIVIITTDIAEAVAAALLPSSTTHCDGTLNGCRVVLKGTVPQANIGPIFHHGRPSNFAC